MCELLVARADMTSPSADRDRLIFCVSFSLSPSTSVFATRSLPARSTSHILLLVCSPFNKFSPLTITQWMLYRVRTTKIINKQWFSNHHIQIWFVPIKKKLKLTSGIGCCARWHWLNLQPLHCYQFVGLPRLQSYCSLVPQPAPECDAFLHQLVLFPIYNYPYLLNYQLQFWKTTRISKFDLNFLVYV